MLVHIQYTYFTHTSHTHTHYMQMYVALFPCNECAKVIIQSGIVLTFYIVTAKSFIAINIPIPTPIHVGCTYTIPHLCTHSHYYAHHHTHTQIYIYPI
ncbi:hypothetical protein EON63_05710 [archaeon]|nr:MAG: hypothetical protein EON63_05710 [archaeon]